MTKGSRRRVFALFVLAMAQLLCGPSASHAGSSSTPQFTCKIVRAFPHDPEAFTQGFIYHDGFFYEGTGLRGRSSLRKVQIESGEVLQRADLSGDYFGEGIAIYKNKLVQLTWQSHIGFVYGLGDFQLQRSFSYSGEGWGLACDDHEFFMSDGTAEIRVLDPATLKEKRRFTVRDGSHRIDQLNELEMVEGELFANIWQTDRIARISPATGEVLGWIDLKGLLDPVYRLDPGEVLNGIAYDPDHKRLFVTGKLWPKVFEIELVPKK